jgi:nucleotide-binding universal stress UspA family protein
MRILLAVDGSPSSIEARDLVASLPWPEKTSVTVLMAYQLPTGWFGDLAAAGWLPESERALEAEAEATLDKLAAPLDGHGWMIDRRLLRGRAASAILSLADEVEADLIVLGSRGHGPIGSMLLGSVSAEVADRARCSVLVARGPRVSRLLVATDGSECSLIIPDVIGGWVALSGLPAVSLSVTPVDSPAFEMMVKLYTMGGHPLEPDQRELRKHHEQLAAAMAGRLSAAGIPARAAVRDGDAAHEIIKATAEVDADLVVTGSHGLRGIDRWLLGSVARNVLLHTKASVLIVRRRDEPSRS